MTAVEKEIQTLLAEEDPALTSFYGMLRYHLGWVDENLQPIKTQGGKRIRPLLCLLVCEAISGDYRPALPAAAAVELVHNFSLIHDDIEDKSPKRRGRATVWRVWGVPQAINTGDGLLALAHLALHRLSSPGAKLLAQATRLLDQACLDLCEGQYLDIAFQERTDVTEEAYLTMARKKTASLMECAAHLGAILVTRKKRLIEAYRGFARNLGLAFQITDDLLGIWGEEERTGKGVGEDIKAGKKSLPVVYAFEEERRRGLKRLEEIYGKGSPEVDLLLPILEELEVKERCQGTARHLQKKALEELERTGIDNQAQRHLRDLALFLVERRF